jgi:hypothetical protein
MPAGQIVLLQTPVAEGLSMRKRISWLPAIAALGLLGTASIAPTFARGGAVGFGRASGFIVHGQRTFARSHVVTPRNSVRNRAFMARNVIGFQNDFRFRNRNQLQNSWPLSGWPYYSWPGYYSWPMDTTPATVDGGPASPSVIVISAVPDRGPERTVPQTPADYSYVPGCHAVPNGYHCDVSPNAGAKP